MNLKKRKGVSDEEEVKEADNKFTKVHIDKFYPSQAVLFDVFVKINDNRYVKILHSGDTFSQERINKYKNEIFKLFMGNVSIIYNVTDDNFFAVICKNKTCSDKLKSLDDIKKYLEMSIYA